MSEISDLFIIFVVAMLLSIPAFLFGHIAGKKGYSFTKYFLLCWVLGFIGWLVVIALPDLYLRDKDKK